MHRRSGLDCTSPIMTVDLNVLPAYLAVLEDFGLHACTAPYSFAQEGFNVLTHQPLSYLFHRMALLLANPSQTSFADL